MDLTSHRRAGLRPWVGALALGATVLCSLAGPAAQAATTDEGPTRTFVVQLDSAGSASQQVVDKVTQLGGTTTRRLNAIGAVVATLTDSSAAALRSNPAVRSVTADASVELQNSTYDPATDPNSMINIATGTGATRLWNGAATGTAVTGKGVDVAVIDSGVAPVEGLTAAGKVVNGPDLSFESQDLTRRYVDTFGHGTFMAGVIAGRDATTSTTGYRGIAPDARIVSVKVADAEGRTDVSQVIAAIDWVVENRRSGDLNIRVLNLSFGTPSLQDYRYDPLSHAAEVAWHNGIVVVASVGNAGTNTGRVHNPAQNPYLIAVGANDAKGTRTTTDDRVPSFSSQGDGTRNPDLVAPGVSVQGLRAPNSTIDKKYGSTAAIGTRFFRGSGTSQAAAVVSGAAALLLEQRPELTPDQVKTLMKTTATELPNVDQRAQGSGALNVDLATRSASKTWVQRFQRSTGTGTLDGARGGQYLVLNGVALRGEMDIMGRAFDSATHAQQAESLTAWNGGSWNGSSWAGSSWAGSSWAGSSWAGSSWAGSSWAGSSWAGSSWAGSSWASSSWG